jgi:thioredoxin-related protein
VVKHYVHPRQIIESGVDACRRKPIISIKARSQVWICSIIILLFSPVTYTSTSQIELPLAVDFQADGRIAAAGQLVILVVVTREGCRFCALLKHEILLAMIKSGEYEEKVMIRELMIEPESDLIDFNGRPVSSSSVAAQYSTDITPTVLLLGSNGKPLHPPIVGINTVEFYGYYLDRAIEQALAELGPGKSAIQDQE